MTADFSDFDAELTKRAFLRGSVGLGAGGALAGTGIGRSRAGGAWGSSEHTNPRFETPGSPSRAAYRALAVVERDVGERSGELAFDRTANAVDYLGLGPDTPVDDALERADAAGDLDGIRLDFPPGIYRISDGLDISPERTFGIVGPEATFRLDSGVRCELNFHLSRGLFAGITLDQRADRAAVSVLLNADDHIDARDLTYRGPVEAVDDDQKALVRPVAANRKASVRIDGLRAVGGTNAGSHAWVGSDPPPGHIAGGVPGAFVGSANEGIVQFVDAELRGWENGLYASRTPGAVQVVGGRFVNNNNTGVRISGAQSFCDGATIVLDARRWPDDRPGRFTIGEIQGVSAARSETGRLNKQGARFRNLDVRGYAMETCPGLVVFWGSAGTGNVTNCRLRTDIDGAPAIRVRAPGVGPHGASSGKQAVRMGHIEILGNMTNAPAVHGTEDRPNSVLANSCVRIPNAGPDDIRNVETRNVGYGDACTASQGLDGRVGAPNEVPSIRNETVDPPSPGPGLPGFGLFVALGAAVALSMATLLPALLERIRQ